MENIYTFDGIPLNDPDDRWFLAEGTKIRSVPGQDNHSYNVPGVDGTTPNTRTNFNEASLEFTLFISKNKTHAEMMETIEFLHGLFSQRHRLIPLVHDYGNGISRMAEVRVIASISNDTAFMRFDLMRVVCSVPKVFWRDIEESTSTVSVGETEVERSLNEFDGSTAPINDALIRFVGPFSTASIEDVVSGDRVETTQAATSTQSVLVDTVNWTGTLQTLVDSEWEDTAVVSNEISSNRGIGTMMTFNPRFTSTGTSITVLTKGTNTTNASVNVTAKRSFL